MICQHSELQADMLYGILHLMENQGKEFQFSWEQHLESDCMVSSFSEAFCVKQLKCALSRFFLDAI